jgi:hypothetical protein
MCQMEPEKLKKSFELRYLMPTGYQMEQEKRDKRFDFRPPKDTITRGSVRCVPCHLL